MMREIGTYLISVAVAVIAIATTISSISAISAVSAVAAIAATVAWLGVTTITPITVVVIVIIIMVIVVNWSLTLSVDTSARAVSTETSTTIAAVTGATCSSKTVA